jgi:multidrug resistance protein, MATE family
MVAVFHIFDATNAVAANNARAYKKAVVPMIAFALALWIVGLGCGYWLAFAESAGAPRLQAQGFWIGAIGGMALSAVICTVYFGWLASASRRTGLSSAGNRPRRPL